MVTKNQSKLITQLAQKKYRDRYKLFVAETPKVIHEFLTEKFKVNLLFTIDDTLFPAVPQKTLITENVLKTISFLKSPNKAMAVFEIPKEKMVVPSKLTIVLDRISDPGNLGTILRLCDWFGITEIMCSTDTTDCFSPKVVQASMGSLARVKVHYTNLETYLNQTEKTVYGTFLDGQNVYTETLQHESVLVMGNEANGISEPISECIDKKLKIPRFGPVKKTESLNVASATAIFLSEFSRRVTET